MSHLDNDCDIAKVDQSVFIVIYSKAPAFDQFYRAEHNTEEGGTKSDVLEDVLDIIDPDDGLEDDFDKELMAESENTTTTVPVQIKKEKDYVKPEARQQQVKREPDVKVKEEPQVSR